MSPSLNQSGGIDISIKQANPAAARAKLFLTSSNRVVECMLLSAGGVQATVVDHRLIVKRALELLATQIIVAHNHPSGSASPSEPDKELTRRIKEAAALFDIALLDHIIIASSGETFSFKGQGLL